MIEQEIRYSHSYATNVNLSPEARILEVRRLPKLAPEGNLNLNDIVLAMDRGPETLTHPIYHWGIARLAKEKNPDPTML